MDFELIEKLTEQEITEAYDNMIQEQIAGHCFISGRGGYYDSCFGTDCSFSFAYCVYNCRLYARTLGHGNCYCGSHGGMNGCVTICN